MKKSVFCLLVMLPVMTWAQINKVLRDIENNNLELKAMHVGHQANLQDMKSENALSGLSVEYSPFYTNGYHGLASSELVISQEIDFPTLYSQRRKQQVLESSVYDGIYEGTKRKLILKAELICIDVICRNQMQALQRQRLEHAQSMQQMLEKRVQAGDANILELNKAKLECMDAKQVLAQLETERMSLLQDLQTMNAGIAVNLTDSVFPEYMLETDCESFVHQMTTNSTLVLTAENNIRAREHDVNMSKQAWLPGLSVGYRRNTEQNTNLNGFMIGASFPLYSTKSKVKAARQRQLSAQFELAEVKQQTESRLRTMHSELIGMRKVLDHTDVELLYETLQLYGKALEKGEISALQYYTEVTNIYRQLESHINLHCQFSKMMTEYKSGIF